MLAFSTQTYVLGFLWTLNLFKTIEHIVSGIIFPNRSSIESFDGVSSSIGHSCSCRDYLACSSLLFSVVI